VKRLARGEDADLVTSAPLCEAAPVLPIQEAQSFTVENKNSKYALNIAENGVVLAVAARQPRQQP
jgi:hypothetical protein